MTDRDTRATREGPASGGGALHHGWSAEAEATAQFVVVPATR